MENESNKGQVLLGGLVMAVLAIMVWLSVAVSGGSPEDARRYVLVLDSALGLAPQNRVAVAGVVVGAVEKIEVVGREAVVAIAILPSVQIHENAKAAVRARSLLGEKYIDLDPGAPPSPAAAEGFTFRNNYPTVEIDQVIRSASELVASLNRVAPSLERAVKLLEGTMASSDGSTVTTELTQVLSDLRSLIGQTRHFVDASSEDISGLAKSLNQSAPKVLIQLDHLTSSLNTLLLNENKPVLKPALDDLKKTSSEIRRLISRLDKVLTRTDAITEEKIKKYLQTEGVRVKMIPTEFKDVTGNWKRFKGITIETPIKTGD